MPHNPSPSHHRSVNMPPIRIRSKQQKHRKKTISNNAPRAHENLYDTQAITSMRPETVVSDTTKICSEYSCNKAPEEKPSAKPRTTSSQLAAYTTLCPIIPLPSHHRSVNMPPIRTRLVRRSRQQKHQKKQSPTTRREPMVTSTTPKG